MSLCRAYPRTPALAAQARFFMPQTAPFRGKPARQAFAGRLRGFDVCDISLPLRRALRPLRESLPDFAVAKSRDRTGALMSTF